MKVSTVYYVEIGKYFHRCRRATYTYRHPIYPNDEVGHSMTIATWEWTLALIIVRVRLQAFIRDEQVILQPVANERRFDGDMLVKRLC